MENLAMTEISFMKKLSSELKQIKSNHKQGGKNNEPDARTIYKFLGEKKLLTPSWPIKYGGLGLPHRINAIVAEQLVLNGISESLYVLSILFAGGILLLNGSQEQKDFYLPQLSMGQIFFSILYSEKLSGSDLSNLTTTAQAADEDNYVINGEKVYSLKSTQADYALCAARTNHHVSKYQGISLFIIPLKTGGIQVEIMPTISDEQFCKVKFEDVTVAKNNLLGEIDQGWSVMSRAISLERTGLDFLIKAIKWHRTIREIMQLINKNKKNIDKFSLLTQRLWNAKQFVYRLLDYFNDHKKINEVDASIAKLICSELAVEIIDFSYDELNLLGLLTADSYRKKYQILDSAFREAPGLTLSAGTTEMMLEAIANHVLI